MIAWSWGLSRLIDVIEADPSQLFDIRKIGVTGCSRNGKGALVAGAFDERIALTIVRTLLNKLLYPGTQLHSFHTEASCLA